MTAQEEAGNKDTDPDTPNPLALAKAEMADGESLVWADTSLAANARRRVIPISLLGWLFLLLTFAWLAKAAIASFWFMMMGLPFLLGAMALATLPCWWPSVTRHRIYAITDRRLLIIQTWPMKRISSYGPEDIDVVERRERRDGSGDLIFRREEYRKLRHHHDPQGKRRVGDREIGFFGVADIRRLESAVLMLKDRRTVPDIDETSAISEASAEAPAGKPWTDQRSSDGPKDRPST